MFSLSRNIFLQNDQLDFFHQCHNQEFATCERSVFIEFLQFKLVAFSARIISWGKLGRSESELKTKYPQNF